MSMKESTSKMKVKNAYLKNHNSNCTSMKKQIKEHTYSIRCTSQERTYLRKNAQIQGYSKESDYVRYVLFHSEDNSHSTNTKTLACRYQFQNQLINDIYNLVCASSPSSLSETIINLINSYDKEISKYD